MLDKEALNNYEMGSPTLTARGKEALSCVIIRMGDVCIDHPKGNKIKGIHSVMMINNVLV